MGYGFQGQGQIVVFVGPAIRGSDKTIDTRLACRNRFIAEEAPIALEEKQALKLFHLAVQMARPMRVPQVYLARRLIDELVSLCNCQPLA